MEIETYEEQEVKPTCLDDKNELLKLANDIGAHGQRGLLDDSSAVIRTFPYRKMTLREKRIYETLLPVKDEIGVFKDSVIPLRVMQIAAHAVQFPETKRLEVWHSRTMTDPLLVGCKENSSWTSDLFILARWGDVLESIEILKKKAIEILRPKAAVAIADARSKIAAWETAVDSRLEAYINGDFNSAHPQFFD